MGFKEDFTSYFLSKTSKTCLASSTLSLGKSAIAIAVIWIVVLDASRRCLDVKENDGRSSK